MALNGKPTQSDADDIKLLPPSMTTQAVGEDSPFIKIRNPSLRKRSTKRPEYVRMQTFGSSADKCGPHQAAREGIMDVLRDFKESSEGLEERDVNGFEPIHHAARADQAGAVEFLLEANVDVNTRGGKDDLTPLHIAVRYNSVKAAKVLMRHWADPAAKNTDGSTPLHLSARHSSQALAELLLSDPDANVNAPDNGGVTAFHLACVSGDAKMCELFLIHEANILLKTAEGRSALHLAALHGHKDVADIIVRYAILQTKNVKEFVNGQDFEDNTPLHVSCKGGHVTTAEVCLTHGADLEAKNAWGLNTALHVASLAGHVSVVKLLVSRGAEVSARNAEQRVALHLAAQFGHCDVTKYLLENGSDIDSREEDSLTPFLLAVRSGMTESAKLLMESGADAGLRTESLKTCLHLAVQATSMSHNKCLDMLRMLCEQCDADLLNVGDKNLRTPLHHASFSGQIKMIEYLLGQNAKVNPRDVFGRTPLHMAAENGNEACVAVIVNAALMDIGVTDDSGISPLHIAAMKGHRKVCKYLIRIGADLNTKDNNRWTPLHHAADAGHVKTAEFLLLGSNVGSSYTIEAEDNEGNTPLIIAGGRGRADVVRLLIERNADVTVRNKKGMTALDVAMENDKMTVAIEILKSDRWFDVLRPRPADGVVPMKRLIETMPEIAEEVMDRCIKCSDDLPTDHPDYSIEFDFRLLDTELEENQELKKEHHPRFFAPSAMVKNEREKLLTHDLTQALLNWKWNCLGRPVFWFNFLTFVCYVIMFTVFVVQQRKKQYFFAPGSNETKMEDKKIFTTSTAIRRSYADVFPILVFLFVAFHLSKGVYVTYVRGLSYFRHFSNYIEWAGYATALMFILPFLSGTNFYSSAGALWPIGAIAILLCFTNVVLFLRRFDIFGLYITMYIEMLKTLVKVLIMFFIFILAFALAFYCLLKEQKAFKTFGFSISKTFMMMVNGMDYQTLLVDSLKQRNPVSNAHLVPVPGFTIFIMSLFVVLITILLVNLLIGLAVGDIDAVRQTASMHLLANDVTFVAKIDESFPKYFVKLIQKPVLTIKPNRKKTLYTYLKYYGIKKTTPEEASPKKYHEDAAIDREEPLDAMNNEIAQQRMRIKRLQATVDNQTVLLQSIAKQLQKVVGAPETPVRLNMMEGLESTGSDLELNQNVGPTPTSPTSIL